MSTTNSVSTSDLSQRRVNAELENEPPKPVHALSVVIPIYRGEGSLRPLLAELEPLTQTQAAPQGTLYRVVEVILVHDGAIDNSHEVMESLAAQYSFVRLIWLSRNFGQHSATLAGMASTTGDWVVTIDEDGQQTPADMGKLLEQALKSDAQLVYALPTNPPPHGWLRNRMSDLAKWVFVKVLKNSDIGRFNSFRLILGEIARSLAAYCGHNVYLDVALSWVVARSAGCPVELREGTSRPSGYNYRKLVSHFWRLVLTSGTRPLRLISLMGVLAIGVAVVIGIYALWGWLVGHVPVPGWTSLIIAICFFAGCILFALGVIAEYLGMALTMAMGKPPYLIVSRPCPRKVPQ